MNKELITITLSSDEVIVLSAFFFRYSQTNEFVLENNAEFIAFSKIAGQLESTLVEPFMLNYNQVLENARKRLSEGYEGLAPGVVP
jgi:hypothetical protein